MSHLEAGQHLRDAGEAGRRFFRQRPFENRLEGLIHHTEFGVGREMLHDDLLAALTVEGDGTGQHLAEHHTQGIDIDLSAVNAFPDLGGHVVESAHAFRLAAAAAARDVFRETVVTDLDHALIGEDIAGLEVAVDDAVILEVADTVGNSAKPDEHLIGRHAVWVALDDVLEALTRDILHDDPGLAFVVVFDVEQ